jgi:hypothetical protein
VGPEKINAPWVAAFLQCTNNSHGHRSSPEVANSKSKIACDSDGGSYKFLTAAGRPSYSVEPGRSAGLSPTGGVVDMRPGSAATRPWVLTFESWKLSGRQSRRRGYRQARGERSGARGRGTPDRRLARAPGPGECPLLFAPTIGAALASRHHFLWVYAAPRGISTCARPRRDPCQVRDRAQSADVPRAYRRRRFRVIEGGRG